MPVWTVARVLPTRIASYRALKSSVMERVTNVRHSGESRCRGWPERYRRSELGPPPGLAVELKRSVQLVHPLSHIDQPKPSGFFIPIKAKTIIGHRKTNVAVGPAKPHFNLRGFRMFCNIAECFLGDAV